MKSVRRVAGFACCVLAGYLAFEVLAHITDRTTAYLTFGSIGLFAVGLLILSIDDP